MGSTKEYDEERRMNFCNWFLWAAWDGALDQRSLVPSECVLILKTIGTVVTLIVNSLLKYPFTIRTFLRASTATQIAEPVFLKKFIQIIPILGESKHISELTTLMTSIEANQFKLMPLFSRGRSL
jgi:hypothetical protein